MSAESGFQATPQTRAALIASGSTCSKVFRDRSPTAANTLCDLMVGERVNPAVRMACAVHILHLAYGKPKFSTDIGQQGETLEDMLRAIHAARAENAQETAEGDQEG
jgi:hypothetical protein